MATALQIAAAIRMFADGNTDAAVRIAASADRISRSEGFASDDRLRMYALAVAIPGGEIADALDIARAGDTDEMEPIGLVDAQDLIEDSISTAGDGCIEALQEHLEAASSCETIDDAIANLREAITTAREIAASCAELAARLEAGKAGGS